MERELQRYRSAIDRIDRRMTGLLKKRFALVKRIGRFKRGRGLPVLQPEREEEILDAVSRSAPERELKEYLRAVYRALFEASRRAEDDGDTGS